MKRGKKIMGLSRAIPKPVHETNPSQRPKSPSKLTVAYEKCQSFLKTPSEMRNARMSDLYGNRSNSDDSENEKESIDSGEEVMGRGTSSILV